ncbi:PD-(D/E)XK nuclease family protein [Candidatus Thioglobus sp.]|uniref:PD-(D/E)XK nuclease family protein n=1 Tax=Candidatus Thioglobus sp. TaxID=2026721 RepID=UPI003D146AE9
MNIFSVLSTGKSNLHEPSMSAMFAYLLNPNQDHRLGRKVINNFLKLSDINKIYKNFIDDKTIKFEIDLEVPYQYKNKRNDIDIQIKILDSSYNELHRIIIENKIKQGAANPKQLNSYYQAVINDKNNDDSFNLKEENLSVIFLTPKPNKGLKDEFDNLDIKNKVWLYWNNEETEKSQL